MKNCPLSALCASIRTDLKNESTVDCFRLTPHSAYIRSVRSLWNFNEGALSVLITFMCIHYWVNEKFDMRDIKYAKIEPKKKKHLEGSCGIFYYSLLHLIRPL